ncbi:MAG TPA: hypothetical protein VGC45_15825 [Gryllotalpicola sp.]
MDALASPTVSSGMLLVEIHDGTGRCTHRSEHKNLITDVGLQGYYGQVLTAGKPALPTGIKLGTGSAAPSGTGAGAALGAYLAGTAKVLDAGFPTVAARVATYKVSYAQGAVVGGPITEAALVTDAAADATSDAAHTWARILVAGVPALGANDSLTLTWTHTHSAD